MKIEDIIRRHLLGDAQVMQVATVRHDQPWICTVWFVADNDLNLYWLSLPARRHSQEIAHNQKVAAAIVIKQDMPTVGLQIEGMAEQVSDPVLVKLIMEKYFAKYGEGKDFYDRFMASKNKHAMYRIKPHLIVLMDEDGTHKSFTLKR
jgi:uncharacterized protein YhbP (UPF0306 family)